ncbi:hypothetical protein NLX83_08235 [Allokutzneria sp. A3M-2-11 16]|uniref:hypothetical protein n=1 Tax=Allokutzneria sp. A3M-2-11 16 TaxID=2962043 RepID=UPI0020B6AED1|nr:hypothetical protein [Allokutzneria sp. A3M-2-11 16]MCP3799243.1 hypothetical protein [Allokutzneria sp. A3M-2-11 16]
MLAIIATLIVIWLAITVIGIIFKGLFWLAVIGGIALVATAAFGALKKKAPKY